MEIIQKIKRKDLNSAGENHISQCKNTIFKTDDQRNRGLLRKRKRNSAATDNNRSKFGVLMQTFNFSLKGGLRQ